MVMNNLFPIGGKMHFLKRAAPMYILPHTFVQYGFGIPLGTWVVMGNRECPPSHPQNVDKSMITAKMMQHDFENEIRKGNKDTVWVCFLGKLILGRQTLTQLEIMQEKLIQQGHGFPTNIQHPSPDCEYNSLYLTPPSSLGIFQVGPQTSQTRDELSSLQPTQISDPQNLCTR